jgi:hypothetical protein
MAQTAIGILGFLSSATLSYFLVLTWHENSVSATQDCVHHTARAWVKDTAQSRASFRPVLVWHRSAAEAIGPAFGGVRETGIRYVSTRGEVVLAVRIEFDSQEVAYDALDRARRSANVQESYDSGLGSAGRYFAQWYLQMGADLVLGDDVAHGVGSQHAIVWVAGDQLEAVCGPNYDSIHRLNLWTRGRPFGG